MSAAEAFRLAGLVLVVLGVPVGVALATGRHIRIGVALAAGVLAVLIALTVANPNATSADAEDYTRVGSLTLIVLAASILGLVGWAFTKLAQLVRRGSAK